MSSIKQESKMENRENTALGTEIYESVLSETDYLLQTTQVQVETQQNAENLKQNIARESFCNYMDKNGTSFESQSPEVKNITQKILRPAEETHLTKKQKRYEELKAKLFEAIKKANIIKVIFLVTKLFNEYLGLFKRTINVSEDLNYEPKEGDKAYFINAIMATLDPEKRSRLAYFLGKIKDKENKEILKEKGIDNPSQFQLFLQNCKPGQLILTNGESVGSNWNETFSTATQIVSGARWCHSAVISDVIKENGVIIDVKIIQASGTGVEEVSLKKYFQENYINSDLLLGTFQPPEKGKDVINKCKKYVGSKFSQINLVSNIIFDKTYGGKKEFKEQEKNKYCSELVFTGMQESGLELPDPHVTPADLLSTSAVNPEYCCYCDSFL